MTVKHMIDALSSCTLAALKIRRENAARLLRKDPDNEDARRLLDAVEAELEMRLAPPRNGWTRGRQSDPRRLMRDGVEVAVVWRLENHTATNGAVWYVTVLGEDLPEMHRHIDDARAAAEAHVPTRGTRTADHGPVNPPAKE